MKSRRIGRFAVNEKLTKQLAVDNWIIYRDPSIGLYCFNVETEQEFNTMYYSAKQIHNLENFLEGLRAEIKEREEN